MYMVERIVKMKAWRKDTKSPSPTKIIGMKTCVRFVNTPSTMWSPVMFMKSLSERETGLTRWLMISIITSQQVREQHEEKRPGQKRKVLFRLLPGAEHALYRGEEKLDPHELVEDALDFVRTNYPMDWRS